MNARSVHLTLLLLLAFLSAHAGALNDISAYTNGATLGGIDEPPPAWTLVIILFDSNGAVTDISTHNDVTNLDLPTAGLSDSYLTSTSGGSDYGDTSLGNPDRVQSPVFDQLPTGVPEPSTFVFLALGTTAFWWFRRR